MRALPCKKGDGVEAADDYPDEECEHRGPEAEERGDHGEQLHVSEAQAFTMANGFVECSDEDEDECGADDRGEAAEDETLCAGEEHVAVCGEGAGARHAEIVARREVDVFCARGKEDRLRADQQEADDDAGEGEGVGEDVGLPVHDEQADEEEAEADPGESWPKPNF